MTIEHNDNLVTVEVTSFTPKPNSFSFLQPDDAAEIEFEVVKIDNGLTPDNCDPEDNVLEVELKRSIEADWQFGLKVLDAHLADREAERDYQIEQDYGLPS